MNKLIFYLSTFMPKMPFYVVYMLQQVDYDYKKFFYWLMRFPSLSKVAHRKSLDKTRAAKLLITAAYIIWLTLIILSLYIIFNNIILGIMCLILTSLVTIIMLLPFVYFANIIIISPQKQKFIAESKQLFADHKATQIAVAGSYGKTSMKEMLATVLADNFNVATTPGNMNTPIAHARFANKLTGGEDIIIIEYGEGAPGDIETFAQTTHPDYAIITGIAPNHLDKYKIINELAKDIFSLRRFVKSDHLFIADNSLLIKRYLKSSDEIFTDKVVLSWKISDIEITVTGVNFTMRKQKQKMIISSKLIGHHQIAPLALTAALAVKLGMKIDKIEKAISKTVAFEHRMQPYLLAGAWVIDDTYNGNIEGVMAGLDLLHTLQAKRKIYVTPGLVEQGSETVTVHKKIGQAIAVAKPDIVVLMNNSNTEIIKEAIFKHGYSGELRVEADPLNFYQNLDQFVAMDDLVLMQNDWTDNYK